jgi:hypothetical protein
MNPFDNDPSAVSDITMAPEGRAFVPPKPGVELCFYYNRYGGSSEPAWTSTGRPALRVNDCPYHVSHESFIDITTRPVNSTLLAELYDHMQHYTPRKAWSAAESVRRAVGLLNQLESDRQYIPHVREVSSLCHVLGINNPHHAYVILNQVTGIEPWLRKDAFMSRLFSIYAVNSATAHEHHICSMGKLVIPSDPQIPDDNYLSQRRSTIQRLSVLIRLAMSTTSTGPYYLWMDVRPRSKQYYEFRFDGCFFLIGHDVAKSDTHRGVVLFKVLQSLSMRYRTKKFNHRAAKKARVEFHGPIDYLKEKFSPMTKIDAVAEKASALIEKIDGIIPTKESVKDFI